MRLIARWITSGLRVARRLHLAGRFYLALNYSWHMAWIKAERGPQ